MMMPGQPAGKAYMFTSDAWVSVACKTRGFLQNSSPCHSVLPISPFIPWGGWRCLGWRHGTLGGLLGQ